MATSQNSKSAPVKIAIAGLGRAGWAIHAEIIKGRSDFKLVAAIDKVPERRTEAEQTFPGCRAYEEWSDFLENPNGAEVVVIATQSGAHAPMTRDALKAGLHVVVEKPMALALKDVDSMIATAKKAKRVLTVHHNHRCDAYLHHLISIINSGILGRVYFVKNFSGRFARRNDWQTLKKNGGGTLNNTGPHTIDQCLQVLQSPVAKVDADLQVCITSGDAEDHVKLLIHGQNGRLIDMEVSDACAFPQPPWVVYGTLGTLIQEGEDFVIKYLDPKKLKKLKVIDAFAVPNRKYGVIGGDTLEWQEKRVKANLPDFQLDYYTRLYASIRQRKPVLVSPESVREGIRVIELARKSAQRKQ
jgi:scyllo-inositol 2-dehydrogenase (NADP+)